MYFTIDNENILTDYFNLERNELLEPPEALCIGNSFVDEYVPYKNYKPYKIEPKNEKEKILLMIRELAFIINDLNLKLDLDPNNKELYKKFEIYTKKLELLEKEYEKKYDVLCINDDIYKGKYSWINGPWPWEGSNV